MLLDFGAFMNLPKYPCTKMPRGRLLLSIWLSCVVRNCGHCVWIAVAVTIAGVASCGDTVRGFCDGSAVCRMGAGFGPAVSIRVVALAKAKGSAIMGGDS